MQQLLVVGLGGCFGAMARYSLSLWMQHRFPNFAASGTLLVNVLGCLLIGMLTAWIGRNPAFSPQMKLLLVTGFLGSLTTFSTFAFESLFLVQSGQYRLAAIYLAGNLGLGLLAVIIGIEIVSFW